MKISGSNSYKSLAIINVAFIAFAFYCYQPFALWFQNDDFTHILLSKQGKLFQHNSFRPVCDLSVMLDYYLWGTNAWGYHLTNLLLHIICSMLVYALCKKLFANSYLHIKAFSLLCASLFFIYAFHSESIFWILGRSALLGTLFSLLFLYLFLFKHHSAVWFIVCSTSYILALLSYESSWVLIIIALLLNKLHGEKDAPISIKKWLISVVLFIIYLVLRQHVTGALISEYEGTHIIHFDWKVLVSNLIKLIGRSFLPPYQNNIPVVVLSVLLIIVMVIFIAKYIDRKMWVLVLCFIVSILPYASLGIAANTTEGERFLYLPSVFICMLLTLAFVRIPSRILRYSCILLFYLIHAGQLYVNAKNYSDAGHIARLTIEELGKINKAGGVVFIENLPQEQSGAFIFRRGLSDALVLLGKDNLHQQVKVVSVLNESTSLRTPYPAKYISANDGKIRLVFTDTALLIYK